VGLGLVSLLGCGASQDENVNAVSRDFHDALAAGDGAAACAVLAPVTRSEREQSAGKECRIAVLEEELPQVEGDAETAVFDTMARIEYGDAVDVAENWQSEFLQFWVYLMATVWLVQRGSPESKELEKVGRESDEEQLVGGHAKEDSPAWAKTGGWRTGIYSSSLAIVLGLIFLGSWLVQSVAGWGCSTRRGSSSCRTRSAGSTISATPTSGRGHSRTGRASSSRWAPWRCSRSICDSAGPRRASRQVSHTRRPARTADVLGRLLPSGPHDLPMRLRTDTSTTRPAAPYLAEAPPSGADSGGRRHPTGISDSTPSGRPSSGAFSEGSEFWSRAFSGSEFEVLIPPGAP